MFQWNQRAETMHLDQHNAYLNIYIYIDYIIYINIYRITL